MLVMIKLQNLGVEFYITRWMVIDYENNTDFFNNVKPTYQLCDGH